MLDESDPAPGAVLTESARDSQEVCRVALNDAAGGTSDIGGGEERPGKRPRGYCAWEMRLQTQQRGRRLRASQRGRHVSVARRSPVRFLAAGDVFENNAADMFEWHLMGVSLAEVIPGRKSQSAREEEAEGCASRRG